jgi:regulator of telomere elongation helicase 1
MCAHPKVRNLESHTQNLACRKLIAPSSNQRCSLYDRVRPFMGSPDNVRKVPSVVDIEDLVHMDNGQVCPYYLARELQPSAEIIFMPYNYIIDPSIRLTLNLEMNNSIIIFDEAHNLESVCCDTASFDLTTRQLTEMEKEVDSFLENYRSPGSWIEEQDDKDQPAGTGLARFCFFYYYYFFFFFVIFALIH